MHSPSKDGDPSRSKERVRNFPVEPPQSSGNILSGATDNLLDDSGGASEPHHNLLLR
jgi:hypothetical protein